MSTFFISALPLIIFLFIAFVSLRIMRTGSQTITTFYVHRKTSDEKLFLGVSKFPDAILLHYILSKNRQLKDMLSVAYIPWDDMDGAIRSGEVNVAYVNDRVASRLTHANPTQFATLGYPIVHYYGLALIARDSDKLPTFLSICEEIASERRVPTCDANVKRTALALLLNRLAEISFIAGTDTDQLTSFLELQQNSINRLAIPFNSTSPAGPDDAFNHFVAGNGSLYVGGITQRLRARGCPIPMREIFAHEQFPEAIPPERNTLVSNLDIWRGEPGKHILRAVSTAWYQGMSDILRNKNCYSSELQHFLTDKIDDENIVFTEDNFDDIIQKWFIVPGLSYTVAKTDTNKVTPIPLRRPGKGFVGK